MELDFLAQRYGWTVEYIQSLTVAMKNGLIAAALQRSRKKDAGTVSDELRMTHEAIVEVMKEEHQHGG